MDASTLLYGQIRPNNYEVLLDLYGHEPPWPMACSPHISLVEAVLQGSGVAKTAYFEYVRRTHGPSTAHTVERQTKLVAHLLKGNAYDPVNIEHDSVLEGNHRVAVAIMTDSPLKAEIRFPYQTLEFPDEIVAGRRLGDRQIPMEDLDGKTVLDLGCAQGMMSIQALRQGAASVVAVDADLLSTTWQLRDAWGFKDKMKIVVSQIEDIPDIEADVVLVYSAIRHMPESAFRRHTTGRICVLETHSQDEPLPNTSHAWKFIGRVPYSRIEPDKFRDLWVGRPL